ncbi:hypothetical protein ACJRO7_009143 [Eucalyptus globulus]|uniref:Uncharacterized protein n=1 Tax=Eucalyptus globulus TaxID=34317 RepID=A0ABD3IUP9_EUCGL
MLDPRKGSLLHLFFTFLILGFAIPSATSRATTVADKSEASTTPPTVAAIDSRDQPTCTMCAACDNPCDPVLSPPPPPPCPPPPPPPCPPPPPPDCPPPPPACIECESPETQSIYASPPPPMAIWTYPYYSRPQDYGISSSLHLEMNAAVYATSLVLSGILYVLHL